VDQPEAAWMGPARKKEKLKKGVKKAEIEPKRENPFALENTKLGTRKGKGGRGSSLYRSLAFSEPGLLHRKRSGGRGGGRRREKSSRRGRDSTTKKKKKLLLTYIDTLDLGQKLHPSSENSLKKS